MSQAELEDVQQDADFDELCSKNQLVQVKGTKSTFRFFTDSAICMATQASAFQWSFQESTSYWELNSIQNSLFGAKVYKCNTVWWFNPNWIVEKIPPGVYHIYIRHGNTEVWSGEFKLYHSEGINRQEAAFHATKAFKEDINFGQNYNQVLNSYVATLDLSESEGLSCIGMEIFSQQNCIQNYLIEGSILVPATDLENPPSFYFPLKIDNNLQLDYSRKVKEMEVIRPRKVRDEALEQKLDKEDDEWYRKEHISRRRQQIEEQKLNGTYVENQEKFENLEQEEDTEAEKRIKKAFVEIWDKYDTNLNGYLEYPEFREYTIDIHKLINAPIDEQKIMQYFLRSDHENRKKLSQRNIQWLIEQIVELLKQQEAKQKECLEIGDYQELTAMLLNRYNQIQGIKGKVTGETEGNTHEDADNILSSQSKWCITGASNATAIINLDEEISFNCLGLLSANDCPYRDPVTFEFWIYESKKKEDGEGSDENSDEESDDNNEKNFKSLIKIENLKFTDRYQPRLFELSDKEPIKGSKFKLYIESNSSELQLSQIMFY
ncbi:UNKNOWN [Stylonychia lemnae]|uniref:EF-hand domain-containing protein n=1 Tax=Stylonychia lemnae TaxID=5949 RepID=A0A078B3F2_STYLE|nr:UNKNOWN [Stylonychia lemnae]|eukprot:CDW88033.1 UNKNOWN [Stylonychia lemnae]